MSTENHPPEGEPTLPADYHIGQERTAFVRHLTDRQLIERYHAKLHELQRLHHELAARVDAAFPGADLRQHYHDHSEIHERRINSAKLWRDIKSRSVLGAIWALVVVAGLLVFSKR